MTRKAMRKHWICGDSCRGADSHTPTWCFGVLEWMDLFMGLYLYKKNHIICCRHFVNLSIVIWIDWMDYDYWIHSGFYFMCYGAPYTLVNWIMFRLGVYTVLKYVFRQVYWNSYSSHWQGLCLASCPREYRRMTMTSWVRYTIPPLCIYLIIISACTGGCLRQLYPVLQNPLVITWTPRSSTKALEMDRKAEVATFHLPSYLC